MILPKTQKKAIYAKNTQNHQIYDIPNWKAGGGNNS